MSQALYKNIKDVFKSNYLSDNRFLSIEEIGLEIYGKMPKNAVFAVSQSINQLMGMVREELEEEGFLMIADVEVDRRNIKGRKLAKPEDADFIVTELQRRAKRKNGIIRPMKRAIENIKGSKLLPDKKDRKFLAT